VRRRVIKSALDCIPIGACCIGRPLTRALCCPAALRCAPLQRRRQGKRRYLLPEAQPRPEPSETAAGGGGAGTSGLSGDAGLGDAEPSLDQMRPELRSLGDSVTSAVR
jgi:hypothetical protein